MISKLDQYIQLRAILFSKERLKLSVDEIASRCHLSRGVVLYAERELGLPPRATLGKHGRPKHPNDKIAHAKEVTSMRAQGLTQAAVAASLGITKQRVSYIEHRLSRDHAVGKREDPHPVIRQYAAQRSPFPRGERAGVRASN